jgi:16S rRNA (guanine966-N2)-methyltransferase
MLRIIAGIYRSRQLQQPPLSLTRATKDRVREAVFAALGPKVIGAKVLDLFAGSGAYGIEAFSRGAAHLHLNDMHEKVIQVIQANLASLNLHGQVVSQMDALKFLQATQETYDLIFLDPPYQWSSVEDLLNLVKQRLNPFGVVVYESESEQSLLNQDIFRIKTYNYGRTYVHIGWKLT